MIWTGTFALALSLTTAAPAPKVNSEASLVFVEEVPNKEGTIDKRRLVRVPFRDGVMGERITVWEGDQRFFGDHGGHKLALNRYVVTWLGGVIDLTNNKVLSAEINGVTCDMEPNRVVYLKYNDRKPQGIFAFDFTTHKIEKVTKFGITPYFRGVISPDGKRAIHDEPFNGKLFLQEGEKRKLLYKLQVQRNEIPHRAFSTMLWLDNESILTQIRTGELVSISLTGQRKNIVKFDAPADEFFFPRLSRDSKNRIVYTCFDHEWIIDAQAGKAEPNEWKDFRSDFEVSWTHDEEWQYQIRHRGKIIGKERYCELLWSPGCSTEGHFALIAPREGTRSDPKTQIRVWCATSQKWITIEGFANSLVGWVK